MTDLTISFKDTAQISRVSDKDVFHAFMVEGSSFEGPFDIPVLDSIQVDVKGLISFSEARSLKDADSSKFVHFFTDDGRFECFWNSPGRYIEKLKGFAGVIEPDFSTCPNFPEAIKIYNTYRNRACSRWLQNNGIKVIPNVRLDLNSVGYSLSGIPKKSTICIGSNGCIKNVKNRERFKESLHYVVDVLEPKNIIVYGSDAYGVFDYPRKMGIPISLFPNEMFRRDRGDTCEC